MNKLLIKISLGIAVLALGFGLTSAVLSKESKSWPSSKKAQKFVKESIVIDFFASPYGVGWNKSEHLHDYVDRAMETGVTGTSATLAATYYTWEQLLNEYSTWKTVMREQEDKFKFVYALDDIEQAHK